MTQEAFRDPNRNAGAQKADRCYLNGDRSDERDHRHEKAIRQRLAEGNCRCHPKRCRPEEKAAGVMKSTAGRVVLSTLRATRPRTASRLFAVATPTI